jgi:APA family basic amino acid/polyamine antiporter
VIKNLLACKSVADITRQAESGPRLNRVLSARALTSIGLGSMIGSGVFVLSGTVAAEHTGPAVTLAFLVAAVGCGLAAICYASSPR